MKFNWGKGIVLAFICFMSFIMYFVIKVQSDHSYDNELVVEDYYKQERLLEAKMEKEKNAAALPDRINIHKNESYIIVKFPETFTPKKITGKVSLYRPSSQNLDFEIPISISNSLLLIPKSDLAGGRWDITVDWQYEGKSYLSTKMLDL